MTTELKGKSALKLSRDIGVTHRTAWFMTHRIRKSYSSMLDDLIAQGGFEGTTEFDETAVGGKVKSMNAKSYKSFKERGGGTGFSGKEIVIGAKNRETGKVVARVIEDRKRETLQGFVTGMTKRGSTIMTDEAVGYKQIPDRKHLSVNHSVNKFVKGMASTNGVESFWSLFKRGLDGVYHKVSPKHLARYVDEFCGRNNDRPEDTVRQMELMMKAMVGQRLTYEDLIRPNGKDNFSRQTRIERERERYNRYVEMSQKILIKDMTALVAMRLKTEVEEALKGLDWDEESDPNQLGLDYENSG